MVRKIRYGIHMGDKTQLCFALISLRCRNLSIYIAFFIYADIRHAKLLHFFYQLLRQDSLARGRRMCSASFIARCRHFNIIQ